MIFVYDNLLALIIGSTVILILFSTQMRLSEVNAQETVTYMTKKHSLTFAGWLEDDLLKLGNNLDEDENPITDFDTDADGRTTVFEFIRDSLNVGQSDVDTVRVRTRYELTQQGSRVIRGETVQLFEMRRKQQTRNMSATGTWSAWQASGRSAALLKHFEIYMLDRDGDKITDPVNADPKTMKQTHASFAMVPPMNAYGRDLNAMNWGANLLLRK